MINNYLLCKGLAMNFYCDTLNPYTPKERPGLTWNAKYNVGRRSIRT